MFNLGKLLLNYRDKTDSEGHKHAGDGKFTSGGGASKKPDRTEKAEAAGTAKAHKAAAKGYANEAQKHEAKGDSDKAKAAQTKAVEHSAKAKDLADKEKAAKTAAKHAAAKVNPQTPKEHRAASRAHLYDAENALKSGDIEKAKASLQKAKESQAAAKKKIENKPVAQNDISETKANKLYIDSFQGRPNAKSNQVKATKDIKSVLGSEHGLHTLLNAFSAPGANPKFYTLQTSPDSIKVKLTLHDDKGKTIGHISREINKVDGKLVAKQDELFLQTAGGTDSTGNGLGSKIIANNFAAYEKLGVSQATVHAAKVGSYVWAKMGYSATPKDTQALTSDFKKYLTDRGIKSPEFKSVNEIANFAVGDNKHGKDFLLQVGKDGHSAGQDDLGWHGEININPADKGYQTLKNYLKRA